ncbi:DUF6470 family protein [Metabacillus halosaccharovorans]|uniref:DUF6470 family protein n=1 Tax=Metabacillus halosaccharovorans TaxID=930124 RepID=UPI0020408E67|nr:DUF6470 family protein [Metabacillus halosaccharovorans]MCM3443755.1 DUF6470 family protein [Metabacillus halosaccharovorans]
MQIQMKSSSAVLAIEKSPSKLNIQQPQAQMDIQQPKPRIEMNKTLPALTIDQTEAWADMNLKGIFRLISEFATEGNQAWMQYLAKTASEGNELMKIENGFGAIASQAKRNGQLPKHEFGLGFIPSPFSVKLNYQPGDVQIQFQPQKLISNITPQKPMIHYQPGSITYHLEQKNSLQFDFTT